MLNIAPVSTRKGSCVYLGEAMERTWQAKHISLFWNGYLARKGKLEPCPSWGFLAGYVTKLCLMVLRARWENVDWMGSSFRAVVFNLVAHWAYLDALRNTDAQVLHIGDSDLINQLQCLGIISFLNAPLEPVGSQDWEFAIRFCT